MYCPALREINRPTFSVGQTDNQEGHTLKRHGNLFEKTFSRDSLYQAYLTARKGKRNKRATFDFEVNLGRNLDDLYQEIHTGIYQPRPYFKFEVYEPKKRTIYAPAFRDIVVQHAIYRETYPLFNATFIDQSFACRTGMGTHKASSYTLRALRQCDPNDYTLKLDVRKFFYSIDRDILQRLIERKIKDRRMVDMMMLYATCEGEVGIPIGNLLSQMYALIYLNPLDHFIKRMLGVQKYVRYVDDFVLIGLTRDECIEYRRRIIIYLETALHLRLSKSTIQKVKRGLNFVGYRTWTHKRFIRKYSLYKFRRALRHNNMRSIVSALGHAKYTNSLPYMLTIIKETSHANYLQLPQSFRRIYDLHCAGRGHQRTLHPGRGDVYLCP